MSRKSLSTSRRWVVKIGSALLTNDGQGLDEQAIDAWVAQLAALRQSGLDIILVSSGAVAAGMTQLGWSRRPSSLHELQAAAAVGQAGLVQTYQQKFQRFQLQTAQVLLDHDDFSSRQRYLNARSTLNTLLELGVIPIVNENDTVVTDEIRFGDNDTLAALVANLMDAEQLVILTDQEGMFDSDPRGNPDAKLISEASARDGSLEDKAGGGGKLGRGGMRTKVRAARVAARSGAHTVIAGGRIDDVLSRLRKGENLGTLLLADRQPEAARKQWLAGHLQAKGKLMLDAGASRVLRGEGKSLLPVGVTQVVGEFTRGELVLCCDERGTEIARGLVNYNSDEARRIIGLSSEKIASALGYGGDDELIHRDNLVLSESL
ncbi:glutamate 5-kinase [Pseudoteredinibacter isoporae]|uniref:glutamate 5-kinase n=1 Tax=Pseudoteredinibacter isoporae TaxID=570281 RepID=UPI0031025EE7